MSDYAWIIDRDHLADEGATPGTNMNAVGVVGPRDADPARVALLEGDTAVQMGRKFRMYDDDGELYYSGRIIAEDIGTGGDIGDNGFAPLDDYGGPNAGATEIRYNIGGQWVTL